MDENESRRIQRLSGYIKWALAKQWATNRAQVTDRPRKHLGTMSSVELCNYSRQWKFLIDEHGADLQRIVWRRNTQSPMISGRLLTVTYGTVSASYLTQREWSDNWQWIIQVKSIHQHQRVHWCDFHVNNFLSGKPITWESARKLLKAIIQLMRGLVALIFGSGHQTLKRC